MFKVTGVAYGDLPYTVTVAEDGTVTGSTAISVLLNLTAGDEVLATPTGPIYVLDLTDPATILAALFDKTDVDEVTGDAPAIIPPPVIGAVY